MSHFDPYGQLITHTLDLEDGCGYIKLTSSTQTLSKTAYPDLFAALQYSIGGSGDSFDIPAEPVALTGAYWYIAAGEPVA